MCTSALRLRMTQCRSRTVSQSAAATSGSPTGAAEPRCCRHMCWINWQLQSEEPDGYDRERRGGGELWLREYDAGRDSSSASLWRYLDSFCVLVTDWMRPPGGVCCASGPHTGSEHSSRLQDLVPVRTWARSSVPGRTRALMADVRWMMTCCSGQTYNLINLLVKLVM